MVQEVELIRPKKTVGGVECFGPVGSGQIGSLQGFEKTSVFTKQWPKTTFEWPKVVSEVSFPTFWGVIRSAKVISVFSFL